MIAFAFALMLAGQPDGPVAVPPETNAAASAPAASSYEEEEICRKVTVPSLSSPGGQKTTKLCKTREEWRDYAKRRT